MRASDSDGAQLNLGLALMLGIATAATWLAESLQSVLSYLTNFGYGAQSSHFSHSGSRLSAGYWTRELANAVRQDLYLPLAALLASSLLMALVAALTRRPRAIPAALRRWTTSDSAIVCFILLEGYVAVSSSRNEGVGFRVALVAALVVLVVAALFAVPWRIPRRLLIAGLISVSAFNLLMKADLVGALSGDASASVPGFDTVPVAHGLGYIQGYVLGSLETRYLSVTHALPASQRWWLPSYARTVGEIFGFAHCARVTPIVELATDEPLLNASDFTLAARLHYRRDLSVGLLPGPVGPTSIIAYERMLTGMRPAPNVVITVTHVGLSYFGLGGLHDADQGLLERAAAAVGFTCGAAVGLPEGRAAVISWRAAPSAPPLAPASCVPRISETSPRAGVVGASTDAPVSAVFTLPMEPASLTSAFTLTNTRTRKSVPGIVTPFGEIAVVLRPLRPLPPHTRFTATLSTEVRAATGHTLLAPERWSFATGG